MEKVNLGFAKFLQFVVIVFFTFVLAFYFGSLLLIPLAILIGIVDLLTAIGFNGVFATILGIPAVGWVCYAIYNIPSLFQALLDTGIKLYKLGTEQNKAFESISDALKPAVGDDSTAAPESAQLSEKSDDSDNDAPTNAKPA
ncbi:MAG: hypothetical protein OEM38_12585 [Gammaproteobacteria bacterium]|nr:hypothetical protein [Gammaproteobacteria bacterium]